MISTRRQRLHNRGRRVLGWGIGLFLLLQLAMGVVVDRYGMPVRLPEAAEDLLPLATRPELADVVVLGSSRSYLGVDTSRASRQLHELTGQPGNVFRAAIFAGNLPTEEYMLQQVLALGARPRVALIEISPEFLARHNDWTIEHIRRQVTWSNSAVFLPQIIHDAKIGPYLRGRCLPLYAYRLPLWQEAKRLWQTGWANWLPAYRLAARLSRTAAPAPAVQGARPDIPTILKRCRLDHGCLGEGEPPLDAKVAADPRQPDLAKRGVVRFRPWLAHYETGGVSVAALERMLRCCQQQGIVPLLLVPPLASRHRELYSAEIEQMFRARLEQLRQKYCFGLADYRSRLPDRCLVDNHHLTAAGSRVFTDLVVRELLLPVWRELPPRRPAGSRPAFAQSSVAP